MMQQPAGVVPQPMPPQAVDPQQQQPPAPAQYGQPPAQQPWMMMAPPQAQPQQPPYQAAPPQMWAPQQQAQPQQYQMGGAAPAAITSPEEIRSLWIGDLQYWMDENYLFSCFAPAGEVVSVKVIRNKQTNISEGYGFIEFANRAAAERTLTTYNGTLMPQTEQAFRLNWATLGAGQRRQDDTPDYTIFVGDLAADVTDVMLQDAFRTHYTSVKGAKVITDHTTGRSKGYGFVRFGDEGEQQRAMTEMNGVVLSTRPMRIGPAANKKPVSVQQKEQDTKRLSYWGPGTDFS
uniref:RRM domain-containing protein n=1 Tax=Opuntia streptacantha TaxID=393608 RepID=A0A7C8ZSP0_OPUST